MRTMSGDKRMILQVTKCTGIPRQLLFAKGSSEFAFKKFLKTSILEKQVQVFFFLFYSRICSLTPKP